MTPLLSLSLHGPLLSSFPGMLRGCRPSGPLQGLYSWGRDAGVGEGCQALGFLLQV